MTFTNRSRSPRARGVVIQPRADEIVMNGTYGLGGLHSATGLSVGDRVVVFNEIHRRWYKDGCVERFTVTGVRVSYTGGWQELIKYDKVISNISTTAPGWLRNCGCCGGQGVDSLDDISEREKLWFCTRCQSRWNTDGVPFLIMDVIRKQTVEDLAVFGIDAARCVRRSTWHRHLWFVDGAALLEKAQQSKALMNGLIRLKIYVFIDDGSFNVWLSLVQLLRLGDGLSGGERGCLSLLDVAILSGDVPVAAALSALGFPQLFTFLPEDVFRDIGRPHICRPRTNTRVMDGRAARLLQAAYHASKPLLIAMLSWGAVFERAVAGKHKGIISLLSESGLCHMYADIGSWLFCLKQQPIQEFDAVRYWFSLSMGSLQTAAFISSYATGGPLHLPKPRT